MGAGQLAAATDLSPGAMTAALDRLERLEYVRRVRSSTDRRSVIVEITPTARRLIEDFYGPIGREGIAQLEQYSDTELAFLRDFLRKGRELQMRHAARIRSTSPAQSSPIERRRIAFHLGGLLMADDTAPIILRLLGAAQIEIAGAPLALHHQKARALLCYLAATGHAHTRDHLAALLWSDALEKNARHSLRTTLYHLRQALQASGAEAALIGDGELISLQLDASACDVARFRRLIADGSEDTLAEAITLYQGVFLQGLTLDDAPLFEEWLRFEQAELRRVYLDALQRLAASAEARQAWDAAIGYLQRLVQLEPLAEEAQRG